MSAALLSVLTLPLVVKVCSTNDITQGRKKPRVWNQKKKPRTLGIKWFCSVWKGSE